MPLSGLVMNDPPEPEVSDSESASTPLSEPASAASLPEPLPAALLPPADVVPPVSELSLPLPPSSDEDGDSGADPPETPPALPESAGVDPVAPLAGAVTVTVTVTV